VSLLYDVRDAGRGDMAAFQRVQAASKGMVNGEALIPQDLIPGYVPARTAAGPLRALTTEHTDIQGREVRLIIEGDGDLVVESVPEGGTKPTSDAAVDQVVSTVFKAAGTTTLPDELMDDSAGAAEEIVASKFGKAVGKKVDLDLLDGTGVGMPLGVLRNPDVNDTPVDGQSAMQVYASIVKALNRVGLRFYDGLVVTVHPAVLERFDLATDGDGRFLFPDGLQGKLTKGRVVEDANVPVAVDGTAPIIVGDWRQFHFFSRQGFTLESNQAPGWVTDETVFRCVERYGAALVKPDAMEIVTGADLDAS
jgi:HK97 family phage major capsid protein